MQLRDWLNKNNAELIKLAKNITKGHEDYMDLFQEVCIQLLGKPDKINKLPDTQKKYFFIRVLKNNWNSNTSPYQYHRQKHIKLNIPYEEWLGENIPDTPYEDDLPDMEWVYQKLSKLDWYDRDLFLLWLELKTFTKVSEETTIPLNSVGKYIKKTMNYLKMEWEIHKKYI